MSKRMQLRNRKKTKVKRKGKEKVRMNGLNTIITEFNTRNSN